MYIILSYLFYFLLENMLIFISMKYLHCIIDDMKSVRYCLFHISLCVICICLYILQYSNASRPGRLNYFLFWIYRNNRQ